MELFELDRNTVFCFKLLENVTITCKVKNMTTVLFSSLKKKKINNQIEL